MTTRSAGALLVAAALVASCGRGGDRTTERSSTSSSASPTAPTAPRRWRGVIVSRTEHRLYVGGTCVSDWRTRVAFMVSGGGEIHGSAFGRLASRGDPCPFPVAQRQIVRFTLDVGGTLHGERLELRLTPMGFEPSVGADDLGGYRSTTIATELSLQVRSDAVDQRLRLRAPDQDRGAFGSVNRIRLRCVTC